MLEAAAPALSAAARVLVLSRDALGWRPIETGMQRKARNAKQRASFDSLVRCKGAEAAGLLLSLGNLEFATAESTNRLDRSCAVLQIRLKPSGERPVIPPGHALFATAESTNRPNSTEATYVIRQRLLAMD